MHVHYMDKVSRDLLLVKLKAYKESKKRDKSTIFKGQVYNFYKTLGPEYKMSKKKIRERDLFFNKLKNMSIEDFEGFSNTDRSNLEFYNEVVKGKKKKPKEKEDQAKPQDRLNRAIEILGGQLLLAKHPYKKAKKDMDRLTTLPAELKGKFFQPDENQDKEDLKKEEHLIEFAYRLNDFLCMSRSLKHLSEYICEGNDSKIEEIRKDLYKYGESYQNVMQYKYEKDREKMEGNGERSTETNRNDTNTRFWNDAVEYLRTTTTNDIKIQDLWGKESMNFWKNLEKGARRVQWVNYLKPLLEQKDERCHDCLKRFVKNCCDYKDEKIQDHAALYILDLKPEEQSELFENFVRNPKKFYENLKKTAEIRLWRDTLMLSFNEGNPEEEYEQQLRAFFSKYITPGASQELIIAYSLEIKDKEALDRVISEFSNSLKESKEKRREFMSQIFNSASKNTKWIYELTEHIQLIREGKGNKIRYTKKLKQFFNEQKLPNEIKNDTLQYFLKLRDEKSVHHALKEFFAAFVNEGADEVKQYRFTMKIGVIPTPRAVPTPEERLELAGFLSNEEELPDNEEKPADKDATKWAYLLDFDKNNRENSGEHLRSFLKGFAIHYNPIFKDETFQEYAIAYIQELPREKHKKLVERLKNHTKSALKRLEAKIFSYYYLGKYKNDPENSDQELHFFLQEYGARYCEHFKDLNFRKITITYLKSFSHLGREEFIQYFKKKPLEIIKNLSITIERVKTISSYLDEYENNPQNNRETLLQSFLKESAFCYNPIFEEKALQAYSIAYLQELKQEERKAFVKSFKENPRDTLEKLDLEFLAGDLEQYKNDPKNSSKHLQFFLERSAIRYNPIFGKKAFQACAIAYLQKLPKKKREDFVKSFKENPRSTVNKLLSHSKMTYYLNGYKKNDEDSNDYLVYFLEECATLKKKYNNKSFLSYAFSYLGGLSGQERKNFVKLFKDNIEETLDNLVEQEKKWVENFKSALKNSCKKNLTTIINEIGYRDEHKDRKTEMVNTIIFRYQVNRSRYTSIDFTGITKEIDRAYPIRKDKFNNDIYAFRITRQKHNILLVPREVRNKVNQKLR